MDVYTATITHERMGRVIIDVVTLADHEHALAEKDREPQQALAENAALYAKQVGEALERLTDDFIFRLAEKDAAYQQLMEQAVRFAECLTQCPSPCGEADAVTCVTGLAKAFLQSPEVQAWKEQRR